MSTDTTMEQVPTTAATNGGALVVQKPIEAVPAFMRDDKETSDGMEVLQQFVIPERLKVVQKTAQPPISDRYNFGDLILTPSLSLLAPVALNAANKPDHQKGGAPFHFVPVFFFAEYCVWNPFATKGTLNTIRARTFDGNSEIARKARNADLRNAEPCPEKPEFKLNYVEHLNFIIALVDDGKTPAAKGLQTDALILTFARGSHKYGSAFCRSLSYRRDTVTGDRAKMFGCIFQGRACWEQNSAGEFYAIRVENPSEASGVPPYVGGDSYGVLREMHVKFRELHAQKVIMPDYGEDDDDVFDAASPSPGNTKREF